MSWKLNSSKAIYLQIIDEIKSRIVSGIYSPGDRLPSVRDLAKEAGVNPNTMQKSLSELERMGLVITNRTSGRHVTEDNSVLKSIQKDNMKLIVNTFYNNMISLGFSSQEILDIIQSKINEEK